MEDLGFAWEPMVVAFIMMALDMIFGFAGAAKNRCIKSEKMRQGLWHKAGFCGIIVLAFAYEIAAQMMNFEAAKADIGIAMPEVPAVTAICCFIVATELISIFENLCELNPAIANIPVLNTLVPHHADSADLTVAVEKTDEYKQEGTD